MKSLFGTKLPSYITMKCHALKVEHPGSLRINSYLLTSGGVAKRFRRRAANLMSRGLHRFESVHWSESPTASQQPTQLSIIGR